MKQRTLTKIFTFLLIGTFVTGVSAFAEDIKTRMKNRLPVIKELKAKGIVGEDNKGYLQFVGGNKAKADVVAAENKDRKTVYAAIAKQQGTTAELVGKRRAVQIAKKADKGEWVQDTAGNWIKTK
jgi:uncharacterized protein YdbL (DUF1318 family)